MRSSVGNLLEAVKKLVALLNSPDALYLDVPTLWSRGCSLVGQHSREKLREDKINLEVNMPVSVIDFVAFKPGSNMSVYELFGKF